MLSDKKDLDNKPKSVTQPKHVLRSIDVTPQHYADLKSLEQNGSYITHEHPSLLNHYFSGIALKFDLFDAELKRDVKEINKITFVDFKRGYNKAVKLWRVYLVDGAKIFVTRKRQLSNNRVAVTVEQDVGVLPKNSGGSEFFVKQMCPFCKKEVSNLDTHILTSCVKK